MFASFNLYFFPDRVSVFLTNSFFYYSAIHLCVCVWERQEEGDIFLADPTV